MEKSGLGVDSSKPVQLCNHTPHENKNCYLRWKRPRGYYNAQNQQRADAWPVGTERMHLEVGLWAHHQQGTL